MRSRVLLLLMLLGTAVSAVAQTTTYEKEVGADPNGQVTISSLAGSVEVIGWDKPQVAVRASASGGEAVRAEVSSSSGHTSVRVSPSGGGDGPRKVHVVVQVPRASGIEVTTVLANISTNGVLGDQELRTVSGSVGAALAAADVEVKTITGSIDLHGEAKPAQLEVSSVSGPVKIAGVAGELKATTVSGTLHLTVTDAREVRVHSTSGAIAVDGSLARDVVFQGETVSGSLRLHARAAAGYEYEVNTFSGHIENCLGQNAVRTSQYAPGERLSGRVGGGDGRVRIRSMSGDLSLCDR